MKKIVTYVLMSCMVLQLSFICPMEEGSERNSLKRSCENPESMTPPNKFLGIEGGTGYDTQTEFSLDDVTKRLSNMNVERDPVIKVPVYINKKVHLDQNYLVGMMKRSGYLVKALNGVVAITNFTSDVFEAHLNDYVQQNPGKTRFDYRLCNMTPLMIACRISSIKHIKEFMSQVNMKASGIERTAIFMCQYPQILEILHAQGADLLHKDSNGMYAFEAYSNPNLLRTFIRLKPQIMSMRLFLGGALLHRAKNAACCKVIIEAGANIYDVDSSGSTALFEYFDKKDCIEMMKMLIEKDKNILWVKNNRGNTILDEACCLLDDSKAKNEWTVRLVSVIKFLLQQGMSLADDCESYKCIVTWGEAEGESDSERDARKKLCSFLFEEQR